MSDLSKRIKKEIMGWQEDIQDNERDADKFDFVFERIYEIIDEESAKEPQECEWKFKENKCGIKLYKCGCCDLAKAMYSGAKFCPYCGRKIKVKSDD